MGHTACLRTRLKLSLIHYRANPTGHADNGTFFPSFFYAFSQHDFFFFFFLKRLRHLQVWVFSILPVVTSDVQVVNFLSFLLSI